MLRRRIAQSELAVGKQLAWDVFDLQGRLLLRKGQTIDSDNQRAGLTERGLFAESGPLRGDGPDVAPAGEHESALALVLEARRRLALVCATRTSKESFAAQITHIVRLIRGACMLNSNVALASILMHRESRYSIRHSVDAAVVSHVVGGSLGMQDGELNSATSAALTMNLSMLSLQDHLQGHAGALSDSDRRIIRWHPDESVGLLQQYGVTDHLWVQAVQDHHESVDGSGYPAKKTMDDLLLPMRLVTLSDIYCTRISGRDYRVPLRPSAALHNILFGHGTSMEKSLAAQFIKALGVYPSGAPVRLNNGEIAIVTQQGEKANVPVAHSVINGQGARISTPIRRETWHAAYGIRGTVDLGELGGAASMQALWGEDAALS